MRTGIMLPAAVCVILAGGAAVFLAVTAQNHSEPSQPTAVMVYMETTTSAATAAEYIPAAPEVSEETDMASKAVLHTAEVYETISAAAKAEFPIDINTASADELMQLPGIGETIAGNIIEYREACGGFTSLSQLLEVSGIGEGRYEIIINFICLNVDYIMVETSLPEAAVQTETETVNSAAEWIPVILDVNEASAEDFDYLPGVDSELAENIVELRENTNGFENPLELLYAEGMTSEIYVSIREYLVCSRQEDE